MKNGLLLRVSRMNWQRSNFIRTRYINLSNNIDFTHISVQERQNRVKTILDQLVRDLGSEKDKRKKAREIYVQSLLEFHAEVFTEDFDKWSTILHTEKFRSNKLPLY